MGNVCFTAEDWRKLEDYTQLCPVEVACMGYARLDGSNVVVDEVFLVPQVISLSSVEFLEKGFPWAVRKAIKEDRINDLRFCWHSHATHGAYFSPTDEDMVRKIRDAAPTLPWFASCVLNKKGETHAQLDYFKPDGSLGDFTGHVTVELDVEVEGAIDLALERIEEMEEFATPKATHKKKPSSTKKLTAEQKVTKPRNTVLPLEPVQTDQPWTDQISGRDWKLHNEARTKGWEVYISDDVAYYWCDETREFKGSAPIPINPKTGEYRIPIEASIIDGSAVDEDDPELVPIDEAEEALLDQAMNAGQL